MVVALAMDRSSGNGRIAGNVAGAAQKSRKVRIAEWSAGILEIMAAGGELFLNTLPEFVLFDLPIRQGGERQFRCEPIGTAAMSSANLLTSSVDLDRVDREGGVHVLPQLMLEELPRVQGLCGERRRLITGVLSVSAPCLNHALDNLVPIGNVHGHPLTAIPASC